FDSHLGYCKDPVVQRRRLLAHIQATMVRVHPGSLGCWSNRRAPAPHAGNEGAIPSRSTSGSNGTTPARHAGNPGSTPGGSTEWKVAGYGWPGRSAKAVLP